MFHGKKKVGVRRGRARGDQGKERERVSAHPLSVPSIPVTRGHLTFLLWRWMSPMELATVLGPSSMRVLRGHSVLTR